ncbi:methyltransferase [Amycolatopsis antarctica]|uniref:Methyltransferase n=1 Tax=Amycolatopsis antarctica TaxID=1854586 RepID=A0A263D2Z7_9PSEU|nr:methyltransferase [Amycolatopsis antarctica]OZM71735.1 methyltransferase [Amycolatopsis antarctica]
MSTGSGSGDDANELLLLGQSVMVAKVLSLIAEIGVADLFDGRPLTVEHLAERTGTVSSALRSFLRLLAGHGVVEELPDGRFELTARGTLLRSDHPNSLRSILRLYTMLYATFDRADHTLYTGQSAFELVNDKPPFEYYRENPELGALFDAAMADMSRGERDDLIRWYDFSPYRHIVDVAGGDGTLLTAVLKKYPDAAGTVFEQEHVVAAAVRSSVRCGLEERMAVVAGDFFTEVASGGDLYILKSVVHDWPKDKAEIILRRCHEAMSSGTRLVLFERVLFPDNVYDQAKTHDVMMRTLFSGAERTVAQFRELLADCGFDFIGTTRVGDTLHAVEATRR